MSRYSRWIVVPALAAAGALLGTGTAYAQVAGDTVYLVADLTGANEVRSAGLPAGDADGVGVEVVAITGNEVRYAIAWSNIAPPTAAHIHTGITGVNGAVKVGFFGASVPSMVRAVVGRITTPDTALLNSIKADPGAFYANVHNIQYPGGAIRGQFRQVTGPIDVDQLLGTGFLRAHGYGSEEVGDAGATGEGDPNGRAWAAVDARGSRVAFALKWRGIQPPTAGHIHEGLPGADGDVVVTLFEADGGIPKSIKGISGVVRNLDSALLARIRNDPGLFYVNLHNLEFPGGAVRGQLSFRRELALAGSS